MIDFEEKYHEYAEKRLREERENIASPEELETLIDGLYEDFANTRADWLGGVSPREYFDGIEDPAELTAMLRTAAVNGWGVPDVLLDRIYDMGDKAFGALKSLAADDDAPDTARSDALSMMREMGAPVPLEICLDLIDEAPENIRSEGEAQALLTDAGEKAVSAILDHYGSASYEGRKIYLDILSRLGKNDDTLELLTEAFWDHPGDRSDYALMLGRLGDERALGPLKEVYAAGNMGYVEYMEIRNAIEMLGDFVPEAEDAYLRDEDYKKLMGSDE